MARAETVRFASTGAQQTFTVPAGVTSVHVVAIGGRGGSAGNASGGLAVAKVAADLPVSPGQVLYVEVGGNGEAAGPGTRAGFNGGGPAATTNAGNGGGASDVRTVSRPPEESSGSLASRLLVAGGSGGAGGPGTFIFGGEGGGASAPEGNGQKGEDGAGESPGHGGGGGEQVAGGAGGKNGGVGSAVAGFLGAGGQGGDDGEPYAAGGGGGGGGYFGGGGGGASLNSASHGSGGGGGGGSSFVAPSAVGASFGIDASAVPSVTFSYTPSSGGSGGPPPSAGPAAISAAPLAAVLSNATQTAQRWREGNTLATLSGRRPPVGTTFGFDLDKAAGVRFDFTQSAPGRNVAGKCIPRSNRSKGKRHCTRTAVRGTLTFAGHSGGNSVRFEGCLSSTKRLKPGKYTLVITATTPGVGSSSTSLTFTIVK